MGGGGGFLGITVGNVKIMEINQDSEKSISQHGPSKRDIQGRERG